MFDNTKLLAEADRIEAWVGREESKFPDAAIERRFFDKVHSVLGLYREAARLGQETNPFDLAQRDKVQRQIDLNIAAQTGMGEALAILQEAGGSYDRDLIARVLSWKPLP